jgi:hypothetical protein
VSNCRSRQLCSRINQIQYLHSVHNLESVSGLDLHCDLSSILEYYFYVYACC